MAASQSCVDAEAASKLLLELWRDGRQIEALPDRLRPRSRREAYAIQALIEEASTLPLWGWKIAATSAAGQRHINVDGPLAGRLRAESIVQSGQAVLLGSNRMRVAEVEFVFRMDRSLPPRSDLYEQAEVMEAVASLHLGIEIPDSRYTDFTRAGEAQIIADDACADRFVLGPEVPMTWRDLDLAAHPVQGRLARGVTHDGRGNNVLGDPRFALTWLVNELSQHGMTLRSGQFVTTGTCVTPIPIEPGDIVTGDYGALGTIQVSIAA